MTAAPPGPDAMRTIVCRASICERHRGGARLRGMNRWRKLLVLLLVCITMPLQVMAALRTHCAPGTPANPMQTAAATAHSNASAMMAMTAMHHGTMSGDSDAMPGMHHQGDDSPVASDGNTHASSHSLHASCSACAACVVCTALPPSVALRSPDAQPSTAIPFLRTSGASAIVAVLERPPKALAA